MSKVAVIDGRLKYDNEENFEKVISKIESWIERRDNIKVDRDKLKIEILWDSYRNLMYHVDDIAQLADSGVVVTVCTDGMAKGFVDSPNVSKEYDLEKWAEDFPSDELLREDHEKYSKKLNEITERFIRHMSFISNSNF